EPGLGGVLVELVDPDTGAVVSSTLTLADGSYIFTGVDPGAYIVRETDPSGFISTTSNTVPVSIGSGGAGTASFGDQAQGTVSGSVFDDLDGDGVQDPGEPGLGGVVVSLIDPGTGATITTTTTGDGSYIFTGVDPGDYIVQESDPDGFTSTTPNDVPVSIGSGGAATANFGDQAEGTVSGSVFNDLDGDGVQGPGETGLGGVVVSLIDPDTGATIITTTTTGNGSYIFIGVVPGDYIVQETDPDGFISTSSNTVPISIGSGGAATANFGDQLTGTISGVVFNDWDGSGYQDSGEDGLGGVLVELVDIDGNVVMTTTTVGDGTYVFTDVPAAPYTVRENDPDGFVSTTNNVLPISMAPGGAATANFGDQLAGTVSGAVFNDLDGNGVQDPGEGGIGVVVVELVDIDGNVVMSTTTAGNGSYVFSGVEPGPYFVRETDPDGYSSTTPNEVSISVGAGGAETANFGDQAQGTVSGAVFDDLNGNGVQDPGEPGLGGVVVSLIDPDAGTTITTTTSGDGSYIFFDVDPGDYIVQETDPDGFTSTTPNDVPISLAPGESGAANFGDQPAGIVSGTVFNDHNGNGVQDPGEDGFGGVIVELIDSSGTVVIIITTTTASDGSYIFTNVPPGDYTVRETDPPGFVSTTSNDVPISLAPGEATAANFGDQLSGTVSGNVFNDLNENGLQDPGEEGIGGVIVELLDLGGMPIMTTTTAGDGSYIFTVVPPGDYTVRETDPQGFISTTENTVPVSMVSGGAATANFGDKIVAVCAFADDYEDDNLYTQAAAILTDGTALTRNFHVVSDKDWVTFFAWAGRTYTVTTSHLDDDVDTVLQFYDLDGANLLDENDDYEFDSRASRIVWTVPQSGQYFARVTHFDHTYVPNDSAICGNHYQVQVNIAPCDVQADSHEPDSFYTQATRISPDGKVVTRTFEAVSDKDWLRFEAQAGRAYTVTTLNLGAATDTVLQLYDTDGKTLLDENDDYQFGSEASRILWTAPKDGVYFVRVAHFDHTYDPYTAPLCGNGYQVAIETPLCAPADVYEPDDHYTLAAELETTGKAVIRSFDTVSDKDWFKFYAQAGEFYTITTFNLDPHVDTVLQLYDVDGVTLLWENDDYEADNKASLIGWAAVKDGWHFVRAAHFDHTYDPRYARPCGSRYDISVDQNLLGLVKLVGESEYKEGVTVDYTVVVWNRGTALQTNVVVTDFVPLYTNYVPNSARTSKGRVYGPDPLAIDIGLLQPGEYVTITFAVQVARGVRGQIINVAWASSDQQQAKAQTPIVATYIVLDVYLPLVIRR
ncbi:MAG: SdrD B-like domain-containing protein, partial [Anaerolineae bacterium]